MTKVAIVGDVHFDKSVVSRTDVYWKTCIDKLTEIFLNNDLVIFLGDFFNRPIVSYEVLIPLYDCLYNAKLRGVQIKTIIGNHDIFNEQSSSLNKTALGWFSTLGVIDVILPGKPAVIPLNNGIILNFYALPLIFNEAQSFLKTFNFERSSHQRNILLSHNYFECQYEGFTVSDFDSCYADYVFFGHEHCPLAESITNKTGTKFLRSGSLMRNSSQEYNLSRMPFYYVLETEKDDVLVSKKSVECAQLSSAVFRRESFEQSNLKLKRFIDTVHDNTVSKFDSIVDLYNTQSGEKNDLSVRSVLMQLNAPVSVMQILKEKYELIGEKF